MQSFRTLSAFLLAAGLLLATGAEAKLVKLEIALVQFDQSPHVEALAPLGRIENSPRGLGRRRPVAALAEYSNLLGQSQQIAFRRRALQRRVGLVTFAGPFQQFRQQTRFWN